MFRCGIILLFLWLPVTGRGDIIAAWLQAGSPHDPPALSSGGDGQTSALPALEFRAEADTENRKREFRLRLKPRPGEGEVRQGLADTAVRSLELIRQRYRSHTIYDRAIWLVEYQHIAALIPLYEQRRTTIDGRIRSFSAPRKPSGPEQILVRQDLERIRSRLTQLQRRRRQLEQLFRRLFGSRAGQLMQTVAATPAQIKAARDAVLARNLPRQALARAGLKLATLEHKGRLREIRDSRWLSHVELGMEDSRAEDRQEYSIGLALKLPVKNRSSAEDLEKRLEAALELARLQRRAALPEHQPFYALDQLIHRFKMSKDSLANREMERLLGVYGSVRGMDPAARSGLQQMQFRHRIDQLTQADAIRRTWLRALLDQGWLAALAPSLILPGGDTP